MQNEMNLNEMNENKRNELYTIDYEINLTNL